MSEAHEKASLEEMLDSIGMGGEEPESRTVPGDLPQRRPLLAALLLESLADEDPVLLEYVDQVVPHLVREFALQGAKGGSRAYAEGIVQRLQLDPEKKAQAVDKIVAMGDQSLLVHILNGSLAVWKVLKLREAYRQPVGDLMKRLFLAAFTLHDMNKVDGGEWRLVSRSQEEFLASLTEWGERLGIWRFIDPEHRMAVAYLLQNTEDVRGANLNLANYDQLTVHPRDLQPVQTLCSLADLFASAVRRPEDAGQHEKIREKTAMLLGPGWRYAYHRLAEVRGLLSNILNNVVLRAWQEQGGIPLLYFPDGVTYLVNQDVVPSSSGLVPQVRERLLSVLRPRLDDRVVGRDGKGLKYPDYLHAFFGPEGLMDFLVRAVFRIIHEKKEAVADKRRQALLETQKTPKQGMRTPADLDLNYPVDRRVDQLAEVLAAFERALAEAYYPDAGQAVLSEMLAALGLSGQEDVFRSIPRLGGVPHPWYVMAGYYVRKHPGLDEAGIRMALNELARQVTARLGSPRLETPFPFLETYVPAVVQTTPSSDASTAWDFSGELVRYQASKGRGGEDVCLLCNSAFASRKQVETEVTFAPVLYTNRQVAGPAEVSRGICAVCSVEQMLRQILMRTSTGKEFENERVRYIYLYPTYYFTPYTAELMRRAYHRLQYLPPDRVWRFFGQVDYNPGRLGEMEEFQQEARSKVSFYRAEYPEGELANLFFFGIAYPSRTPTETESWILPLTLALVLPAVLGVKVVATPSQVPLHNSGADFAGTVILDSAPLYWQHLAGKMVFRLDELPATLKLSAGLHSLAAEAYRSGGFPDWDRVCSVSRNLKTDPLWVFGYADRIAQGDGMFPAMAERLIRYYELIGGDRMGLIARLVEGYTAFYRATSYAAHARLRPLSIAADVVLKGDPLDRDSLLREISGEIEAFLGRVHGRMADGFAPLKGEEERRAVDAFAELFLEEVFEEYCGGDRATLRQRLNRLKNACEAEYVRRFGRKKDGEAGNGNMGAEPTGNQSSKEVEG